VITTNVIHRVVQIKINGTSGTCFTFELDKMQYIITARHIANSITGKHVVEIFHEDQWEKMNVNLVGHGLGDVDITVLSADVQVSPTYPMEPTSKSTAINYGQDVYFLGFPYGMSTEVGEINSNFPLPFVKKAILSCLYTNKRNEYLLYLDGYNNPGFSGGPVVYLPENSTKFCVASVISGFRFQREPIFQGDQAIPLEYKHNTGIIVTYGIQHAIELITNNPIGYKLEA